MAGFFFRFLLLFTALVLVHCVPVAQNVAVSQEPTANNDTIVQQWMPEPRERGTFRIIFSCCTTLFLCVCE